MNMEPKVITHNNSDYLEYKSNGDGTCTIIGMGGCFDNVLMIPQMSPSGEKVTHIGKGAFREENEITDVIIAGRNLVIARDAFADCKNIRRVFICDSALIVLGYAFTHSGKNMEVQIVNSYIEMRMNAFWDCNAISLEINNSTTNIMMCGFGGCIYLKNVTIGNGNTKLNDCAFYCCENLEKISIGIKDSVKNDIEIGKEGLVECGARKIIISGKNVLLGEASFESCNNLKEVIIEAENLTVGPRAFYFCPDDMIVTYNGKKYIYERYIE